MKKIHLLYLIPSLENSGGMERVLTHKVNFLIKTNNYIITIITTDMADDAHSFFELDSSINLVKFKLFFNEKFNLPIIDKIFETHALLKTYKNFLTIFIKENNVDICISMGAKDLEFLYKIDLPCKKIFEAHFSKGIRTRMLFAIKGNALHWRIIAKIRELQNNIQTKKLDKVIVLTEKSRRDWEISNSNIAVIPNPSSFKTTYEFPEHDSKRVIAIGRLEFEKGFDLLIQAWESVRTIYPDWKLNIFGDGTQKNNLEYLIDKFNLSDSVLLKGTTDNVSKELLNSSFLVLSSRFEGMPMVMLESMACGLPMVAFDCETGPSELIENNDCGFLVDNGSVNMLSEKIIVMIRNKEKRLSMSNCAKIKSENYNIDKIMEKWENLFLTLAK